MAPDGGSSSVARVGTAGSGADRPGRDGVDNGTRHHSPRLPPPLRQIPATTRSAALISLFHSYAMVLWLAVCLSSVRSV